MKNTKPTIPRRIKPRKKKIRLSDLPLSPTLNQQVEKIAQALCKQIDKEIFSQRYAPAKEILKLIGAGAFIAASLALPTLPMVLKPFFNHPQEHEVWKRFNIPYLRRTLKRLERQKLVEIKDTETGQEVSITDGGRRKILQFALDELTIKKPAHWNGTWVLVSYDIPLSLKHARDIFREYLKAWNFYPLHESAFLHAYPCADEVTFLKEYLGLGEYVRIFNISSIENSRPFREFFGI